MFFLIYIVLLYSFNNTQYKDTKSLTHTQIVNNLKQVDARNPLLTGSESCVVLCEMR